MSDIRRTLEEALDEVAATTPEKVRALVMEAFELEKHKEIWVPVDCKFCHRSGKYALQVPIPDFRERAKAIEILANQAKGKPAESKRVSVTVRHELAELSDEQLAAIAEGRADIELPVVAEDEVPALTA